MKRYICMLLCAALLTTVGCGTKGVVIEQNDPSATAAGTIGNTDGDEVTDLPDETISGGSAQQTGGTQPSGSTQKPGSTPAPGATLAPGQTNPPTATGQPYAIATTQPTAVVYPVNQPLTSLYNDFSEYKTGLTTYQKLPDPFRMADGSQVSNLADWNKQRQYLKEMLCYYVYGPRPSYSVKKVVKVSEFQDGAVSSNAITSIYNVYYDASRFFRVRITRPAKQKVYPVIMRYESNMDFRFVIENNVISTEKYVIVAINHLDAYNDSGAPTQSQMHEYQAVMAWAYQATLTMDFLSTLNFVDMSRIAITGHSRTGKAALCAAAYDDRIALTIPNSSGAAGASTLRKWGQSGAQGIDIASNEPDWISDHLSSFTGSHWLYGAKVDKLPLDMHFARALIAPRPILCTESRDGGDSIWAGANGTYTAWAAADPVYKMYGAGKELNNLIHTRAGQHDQLESDYWLLVGFCDYYFYGSTTFNRADYRVNTEYDGATNNFSYTNPFTA